MNVTSGGPQEGEGKGGGEDWDMRVGGEEWNREEGGERSNDRGRGGGTSCGAGVFVRISARREKNM